MLSWKFWTLYKHHTRMATTCQRHAKTIAIQAQFVLGKRFQDRCACFLQLPEGQVGESQEVLYQSGLASNWSLEFADEHSTCSNVLAIFLKGYCSQVKSRRSKSWNSKWESWCLFILYFYYDVLRSFCSWFQNFLLEFIRRLSIFVLHGCPTEAMFP